MLEKFNDRPKANESPVTKNELTKLFRRLFLSYIKERRSLRTLSSRQSSGENYEFPTVFPENSIGLGL